MAAAAPPLKPWNGRAPLRTGGSTKLSSEEPPSCTVVDAVLLNTNIFNPKFIAPESPSLDLRRGEAAPPSSEEPRERQGRQIRRRTPQSPPSEERTTARKGHADAATNSTAPPAGHLLEPTLCTHRDPVIPRPPAAGAAAGGEESAGSPAVRWFEKGIPKIVCPHCRRGRDTVQVPSTGITSVQVASQCLLQAYANGNVQLVNRADTQKISQFSAHFMGSTDQDKGCNFAAYVPSEEDTPLQRAEWIKYLGTFTNSEDRANAVYYAIKTNYLCLSKSAANLSTRFKPIVAWVEYTEGVWTFVKESYKLQYVTDAGAEIVDATITDKRFNISDPEDMDNLHAILCTVDVVIDQTYASDPAEYKLSTFLENINVGRDSCFSFLTNQSIWRFDKRIGDSKTLDWFDGAISQPQLVLADLIEAFFQTGNYMTVYFRNLAKDEGITELNPAVCSRSISTPMEPTILPCQ